jgi:hypothetical protein
MPPIPATERPAIPAVIRLHKKYHGKSGCIRREILMWHNNKAESNLKGIPNAKPGRLARLSMHMGNADYNRNRQQQMGKQPYKGSEDEMEHRLGWRLPGWR